MAPERWFRIGLGAGALVVVGLQIAALGRLQSSLWGLHTAAFLPRGLAVAGWIVAIGVAIWLLFPARFAAFDAALTRRMAAPRTIVALPLLLIVCGGLFWLLRSQQTVLGDAWPLVTELPHGLHFHPRQPFSIALQQAAYRATGGWFGAPSADGVAVAIHTVALANVIAGVLFAALAWWLGRLLSPSATSAGNSGDRTSWWLTLFLLAQGYASLFYGYLETYAFDALAFAAYLAAGLAFLRGRLPLAVAIVAFLIALGLHLSAVALLPSLVLLAFTGFRRARMRRGVLRDLLIGLVAAVVLDRIFAKMSPGYSLRQAIEGILKTASDNQGGGAGLGYFFSARHWGDFLNAQHLIGPLAAGLFVPALCMVWLRYRRRDAALAFVGVAALTLYVASTATSEPLLGYARDWDLFAPSGVAYTVAGLAFFLALVPEGLSRQRFLAAGVLLSALQLGAWVLLNHDEARSMQRFATLHLGLGRTEVVMGNWHYRNGRIPESVTWFEKALRTDPRNSTAWAFLGQIEAQAGDMPGAAKAFASASALRPDKALYRHNLVKALEAQGKLAETLPHYEILSTQEPYFVDNPIGWAEALRATGREAEATAILQQALQRFEARHRRTPGEIAIIASEARLLGALGRTDEALRLFDVVLRAQPDSDVALYERGSMLVMLGRPTDARPSLLHLLQVYPQHPARDQIRVWLALADSSR